MKGRRNEWSVVLVFLAPNLCGFLLFTFGPMAISLAGSFTSWSLRPGVPIFFIGWENYRDLFLNQDFWFYLFNTGYFMLRIPFAIACSLFLALVLHRSTALQPGSRVRRTAGPVLLVTMFSSALLLLVGHTTQSLSVAALGLLSWVGLHWGSPAYRAIFYLPRFTAGAATMLLWGHLLNPNFGLLNQVWSGALDLFGFSVSPPKWLSGTQSLAALLPLPSWFSDSGFGLGAREGIMLMLLWAGIGGNTMLLFLAALATVPEELYEAAAIDGAGRWAAFWHVTLPQIAPTTFFIVVMALIGGFQGGFEEARLMTGGGPAGMTTTVTYYMYVEGFERLELGYGSAIAWVLFALIFSCTLLQWQYGRRSAND